MVEKHDLMHKACGWMLRELGKKDINLLTDYLETNYIQMPRTMLRYAIEKYPEDIRKRILKGDFLWR
jgi:3-methyladenine DNA glycosylase AlkD